MKDYSLTLAAWPGDIADRTSGFMGVEYYDGAAVMSVVQGMLSPLGFFQFLIVPFANDSGVQFLRILAFETPDTIYYQVPFEGFWGIVHLLFWCAWININVGIFNAIPMIPLDGGYIFKEGVDRLLDRRGLLKYSGYVTGAVELSHADCPCIAYRTALSSPHLIMLYREENCGFHRFPPVPIWRDDRVQE